MTAQTAAPAAPTTAVVSIPALLANAEALATAPSLDPAHGHSTNQIAGYVIRQTVRDGYQLADMAPGRPGIDRMVFQGARSYGTALEIAQGMRRYGKGVTLITAFAVVDTVYTCGCRS